jgi:hypothetical protein
VVLWRKISCNPGAYPAAEPKPRVEAPVPGDALLGRGILEIRSLCRPRLAALLLVSCFVGTPAIAQQDEAAALDKRVGELYQAGKFSDAVPLSSFREWPLTKLRASEEICLGRQIVAAQRDAEQVHDWSDANFDCEQDLAQRHNLGSVLFQ